MGQSDIQAAVDSEIKTVGNEMVEAAENEFTHFLHLVDGSVKRWNVSDKPLPSSFNGVAVSAIHPATAPGPDDLVQSLEKEKESRR